MGGGGVERINSSHIGLTFSPYLIFETFLGAICSLSRVASRTFNDLSTLDLGYVCNTGTVNNTEADKVREGGKIWVRDFGSKVEGFWVKG